jgi:hypothetical protein
MSHYTLDRKNAKASDFFFYIGYEKQYDWEQDMDVIGPIGITICPKDFFLAHGCVYDQHLSIYHILPEGFSEIEESQFETIWETIESARNKLLEAEFVEDDSFSDWCKNHDPYC